MPEFLQITCFQSKRISVIILALSAFFLSGTVYGISDGAYRLKRVVIDPGHGGRDPGAVGRISKEKDIVLDISLKLGGYINQYLPDVEVIYTRTGDEFVELHRRAEIANKSNADLFISIHANANTNRNIRGTDTFVMGHHTSKENLEVAMKENAAILLEDNYSEQYEGFDPNSSESYIIFSLLQNAYDLHSLDFASHVQTQFRERTGRIDRGVRRAGFLVLWQTTMPSVLIEVGFISNEQEELYLMSEEGQAYIASAIFRAFRDHKASLERKSDALYASTVNGLDSNRKAEITVDPEVIPDVDIPVTASPDTKLQSPKITFKVQVGSSRSKIALDSDYFGGLENIEVYESDGLFKYVVGNEASLEDIVALRQYISRIFPDAFVVAVREGALISLQEALKGN